MESAHLFDWDTRSPSPPPSPAPAARPRKTTKKAAGACPSIDRVFPEFGPLVRVLQEQRGLGNTPVEASQLGGLLAQAPGVRSLGALYERAGESRLRGYTQRAADYGIVRIIDGYEHGRRYVALTWDDD